LLSSHLLSEVEQICDEVTIVNHGRTITSGPVRDVLSKAAGAPGRIRVGVGDPAAAGKVLAAAGFAVDRSGDHLFVAGAAQPSDVTRTLAGQGIYLSELVTETVGLEEAFLLLTDDAATEPST
jgi:ABC-2 type transport system ATP-binding protein